MTESPKRQKKSDVVLVTGGAGLVGRAIKQCVEDLVERFGRRGTEPNELFRSEFGQNSCKIQEFSLENSKNSENFNMF